MDAIVLYVVFALSDFTLRALLRHLCSPCLVEMSRALANLDSYRIILCYSQYQNERLNLPIFQAITDWMTCHS